MPLYGEGEWGECRYGLSGGCLPPDWFQIAYDSDETAILSMVEFDSVLYAGSSSGGKIYKSSNGTTWELAYDSPEAEIHDLIVFDGDLYAATGNSGLIYKTSDGSTWSLAYDSPETDILCLEVFGANLYAGSSSSGIIYKTGDGSTWSLSYDSPESHIYAMEVFDSYLYAGTGDSGLIYRSNDGSTWSLAYDSPQTAVLSLARMGSDFPSGFEQLFAGSDSGFLIYKTSNGTTWEVAYDGPDALGGVQSLYGLEAMVYAGSGTGGVLYHSDNGVDWLISYDSPAATIYDMTSFSQDCGTLYIGTGDSAIIYSMDNLVEKDLIADITAPDGGETITTDTYTIQWSMEETDYTNIVWDIEYTRNYSTNRTWEVCVDDTGGDPEHTGDPLTGISTGDKVVQNGNYLETTWNVLPIIDSTDMAIRIRSRDTSQAGCAGYGSWNESADVFELNNGPC